MRTNETFEMTAVKANVFDASRALCGAGGSMYRQSVVRSVRQRTARHTSLCVQSYEASPTNNDSTGIRHGADGWQRVDAMPSGRAPGGSG